MNTINIVDFIIIMLVITGDTCVIVLDILTIRRFMKLKCNSAK